MLINHVNQEIAKRTKYGVRVEVNAHPGWVLIWSNASRMWFLSHYVRKVGLHIKLDANCVFVEGSTQHQLTHVLDELIPHPLYENSFEARYERR